MAAPQCLVGHEDCPQQRCFSAGCLIAASPPTPPPVPPPPLVTVSATTTTVSFNPVQPCQGSWAHGGLPSRLQCRAVRVSCVPTRALAKMEAPFVQSSRRYPPPQNQTQEVQHHHPTRVQVPLHIDGVYVPQPIRSLRISQIRLTSEVDVGRVVVLANPNVAELPGLLRLCWSTAGDSGSVTNMYRSLAQKVFLSDGGYESTQISKGKLWRQWRATNGVQCHTDKKWLS